MMSTLAMLSKRKSLLRRRISKRHLDSPKTSPIESTIFSFYLIKEKICES